MAKFVLTAQLQLQAPRNVQQVVRQIQSQLNDVRVKVDIEGASKAQTDLKKLDKGVKQVTDSAHKMGQAFAVSVKRFAAFSIATRAIGLLTRGLGGAVSEAIDFERQLVKVSQVTGKSIKDLKGLTREITRLSTSLGVSSKSLIEVSKTLSQAGLDARETKVALDALAKTSLAATFTDIHQTAEGAVAIFNQFGAGAEALEKQLGSINAVAGQFAVEAGDIISAIRRTGGVFKAAGGDLNELIALFTSVRATTRESAESIATGLRTIFTRIQRPSTIKFLKQLGVELVDAEGKFVGPFKAVQRLSEAMSNLKPGDLRFVQIAEQLGGFRQIGKVIPLLQQFAVAQDALNVALDGQNSLAADAEKAQGSLAVRIVKVKEEFLALIRATTESKTFQVMANTALSLASALIKIADALKPLLPLLAAMAAMKIFGGIKSFSGGMLGKVAGGGAKGFASGGLVPGSGNRDTVPAMLTPGEFVIKKSSVKSIGADRLAGMNKYAKGGPVIDLQDGTVGGFFLVPSKGEDRNSRQKYSNIGKITNRQVLADLLRRQTAGPKPGSKTDQAKSKTSLEDQKTSMTRDLTDSDASTRWDSLSARKQRSAIEKDGISGTWDQKLIKNPGSKLPSKGLNLKTVGRGTKGQRLLQGTMPAGFQSSKSVAIGGRMTGMLFGQGNTEITGAVANAASEISSKKLEEAVDDITKSKAISSVLNGVGNTIKPNKKSYNKTIKELISKDNTAVQSIEGYVQEGLVSALTGATVGGGEASFDFPRLATHKKSLEMLYGPVGNIKSADAKRNMKGSWKKIATKTLNTINSGNGSELLENAVVSGFANETPMRFAKGGSVTDTVPALLTPGEFVVNKQSAQGIGYGNLHRMNSRGVEGFASGGIVGGPRRFAEGGSAGGGGKAMASMMALGMVMEMSSEATMEMVGATKEQTELFNELKTGIMAAVGQIMIMMMMSAQFTARQEESAAAAAKLAKEEKDAAAAVKAKAEADKAASKSSPKSETAPAGGGGGGGGMDMEALAMSDPKSGPSLKKEAEEQATKTIDKQEEIGSRGFIPLEGEATRNVDLSEEAVVEKARRKNAKKKSKKSKGEERAVAVEEQKVADVKGVTVDQLADPKAGQAMLDQKSNERLKDKGSKLGQDRAKNFEEGKQARDDRAIANKKVGKSTAGFVDNQTQQAQLQQESEQTSKAQADNKKVAAKEEARGAKAAKKGSKANAQVAKSEEKIQSGLRQNNELAGKRTEAKEAGRQASRDAENAERGLAGASEGRVEAEKESARLSTVKAEADDKAHSAQVGLDAHKAAGSSPEEIAKAEAEVAKHKETSVKAGKAIDQQDQRASSFRDQEEEHTGKLADAKSRETQAGKDDKRLESEQSSIQKKISQEETTLAKAQTTAQEQEAIATDSAGKQADLSEEGSELKRKRGEQGMKAEDLKVEEGKLRDDNAKAAEERSQASQKFEAAKAEETRLGAKAQTEVRRDATMGAVGGKESVAGKEMEQGLDGINKKLKDTTRGYQEQEKFMKAYSQELSRGVDPQKAAKRAMNQTNTATTKFGKGLQGTKAVAAKFNSRIRGMGDAVKKGSAKLKAGMARTAQKLKQSKLGRGASAAARGLRKVGSAAKGAAGKLGKGLAKMGAGLAAGAAAAQQMVGFVQNMQQKQFDKQLESGDADAAEAGLGDMRKTDMLGGAAQGAAMGAMMGAMFGPLGMAIGAIVGAIAGWVMALAGADKKQIEREKKIHGVRLKSAQESTGKAMESIGEKGLQEGNLKDMNAGFKKQEALMNKKNTVDGQMLLSEEERSKMEKRLAGEQLKAATMIGKSVKTEAELEAAMHELTNDTIGSSDAEMDAAKTAFFVAQANRELAKSNADLIKITSAFQRATSAVDNFVNGLETGTNKFDSIVSDLEMSQKNIALGQGGVASVDAARDATMKGLERAGVRGDSDVGQAVGRSFDTMEDTATFMSNLPGKLENLSFGEDKSAKGARDTIRGQLMTANMDPKMKAAMEKGMAGMSDEQLEAIAKGEGDISQLISSFGTQMNKLGSAGLEAAKALQKHEATIIKLTQKRIIAEQNYIEAQKNSIDIMMEANEIIAKVGGPAVTPEMKNQATLAKANLSGDRLGLSKLQTGDAGELRQRTNEIMQKFGQQEIAGRTPGTFQGSQGLDDDKRGELKKAMQDQIALHRDLIKGKMEELKILDKKNALEKSSLEDALKGDMQSFLKKQAAVGATAAAASGDQRMMRMFGVDAIATAFSNIEKMKSEGVQEVHGVGIQDVSRNLASTGLAMRGLGGNDQMTNMLAGQLPEQEALKNEIKDLAVGLSETGQGAAQLAEMEVDTANITISTANFKFNEQLNQAAGLFAGGAGVDQRRWGGRIYASRGMFVPRGTDTVPAMLTPGEFVVRKESVNRGNNLQLLRSMNNGSMVAEGSSVGFAKGGRVGYYQRGDVVSQGAGIGLDPTVVNNLSASLMSFNKDLAKNISSLENMKFQIRLDTTNINVNLNGTSFLAQLKDSLKEELLAEVGSRIKELKFNDAGEPQTSSSVLG